MKVPAITLVKSERELVPEQWVWEGRGFQKYSGGELAAFGDRWHVSIKVRGHQISGHTAIEMGNNNGH